MAGRAGKAAAPAHRMQGKRSGARGPSVPVYPFQWTAAGGAAKRGPGPWAGAPGREASEPEEDPGLSHAAPWGGRRPKGPGVPKTPTST